MLKENKSLHIQALKCAFKYSAPIMAGFLFLGASYGIIMNSGGFPFWYPILTSAVIFAGSMEFLLANLLLGAFDPIGAILMTLMINARHIFYGVSLLDKYKGLGWKKIYMIFGLCDETFSINCSAEPGGVDKKLFMFYVTLLDQTWWVLGATVGGVFGSIIDIPFKGIDFAMTAMFVVILLEQLLSGKKNIPTALIGLVISLASLIVFGKDSFIIPAMLLITVALGAASKPISKMYAQGGSENTAEVNEYDGR